jgi:YidC/Oxa1 family membrane protein insertase
MDKKMILAIVASMLILIGWPMLSRQKQNNANQAQQVQQTQQAQQAQNKTSQQVTPQDQAAPAVTAQPAVALKDEKIYFLENEDIKVSVSSYGTRIKQIIFKKYTDEKKEPLRLNSDSMEAQQGLALANYENSVFSVIAAENPGNLVLEYKAADKSTVKRTFTLDSKSSYLINMKTEFSNPSKLAYSMNLRYTEDESNRYGMETNPDKRHKDLLFFANENAEKINLKEMKEPAVQMQRKLNWFGYTDRYFLFAMLSGGKDTFTVNIVSKAPLYQLSLAGDTASSVFDNRLYVGPKDVSILRLVDNSLTASVDYGWLNFLCVPILELMKFFYRMIPNYGLAIILLTLFIRLLLYPLQMKSMKSMKKLQELQPHIKKLQEKHKEDKQKMNQELMQFMKTHKVNPMGGCLPMLLQLPVFIALYNVLGNAVELYKSPFMFWISDLSVKDPYYILPVLMVISMVLQQKLTPNPTMDPTQAKMMMIMPVVFGFLMINLPSGLTLYIFLSTILGVVQQYMMNRKVTQA